jgi:hypothetical protein
VAFAPLGLDSQAMVTALAVRRIAESYGVTLTRVGPGIVSLLLSRVQGDGFGVRTLEYLVERELGELFAAAAVGGDITAELVDPLEPGAPLVVRAGPGTPNGGS